MFGYKEESDGKKGRERNNERKERRVSNGGGEFEGEKMIRKVGRS